MKTQFLGNFLDLFYPRLCPVCGWQLLRNEKVICTKCLLHLPKANYHLSDDNPVAKAFWGRVQVENATAWYFFEKGSSYQKLIHKIKYMRQKGIGYELGIMFGEDLSLTLYQFVDELSPVPLHSRKLKKRGFNQSEWIARGIAESMNKQLNTVSLQRIVASPTQTRKSRYERWENVADIFQLTHPEKIENKHILLIDDVMTTGSTLEACASTILKAKGTKVSIAVLAYAL